MTYDQAKRMIANPDAHTDEELSAAWAVYVGRPSAEEAQPLPSDIKVYRPRDGVVYWWDVPSKSWHLKVEGHDLQTFKLMKQAKSAIPEGY